MDGGEWEGALDLLRERYKRERDGGGEEGWDGKAVQEVEVLVGEGREKVVCSGLMAEGGMHYVLSFEREKWEKMVPSGADAPLDNEHSGLTNGTKEDPHDPKGLHDIFRIKKAVFDSCKVAGFILTADEKFYLTNKSARELLGDIMGGAEGCDGTELRQTLEVWDENFTRRLQKEEFPAMKMIRSRVPFKDYRCGFTHTTTGDRIVANVSGECLFDDDTGEFVGGLCWCYDWQEYSGFLIMQQQKRLESHETICNLMPHLVWTTTPEGLCDWFSDRWYTFTGMTKEESLGTGFAKAIHPEDLPVILGKFEAHRLTGEECEVEVRYLRNDGIYKWMLARAVPFRDSNGKILKWYGTNTDIHDLIMARIEAARNKLQMLTVLAHAEVNLFSIGSDRKVTMAEGGMLWETKGQDISNKSVMIGQDAIELSQSTQEGGVSGKSSLIIYANLADYQFRL